MPACKIPAWLKVPRWDTPSWLEIMKHLVSGQDASQLVGRWITDKMNNTSWCALEWARDWVFLCATVLIFYLFSNVVFTELILTFVTVKPFCEFLKNPSKLLDHDHVFETHENSVCRTRKGTYHEFVLLSDRRRVVEFLTILIQVSTFLWLYTIDSYYKHLWYDWNSSFDPIFHKLNGFFVK